MRRHSVVIRSTRIVLGILVAGATLAACASKERPRDSTGTAPDTTRPPGSDPGTAALPGELTKPLDQYSGDEMYDFVRKLSWGGGADVERKCKDDPSCDGEKPATQTLVRVDAVDGQDSISAINLPKYGAVGMRALNRGKQVEERYGFKPAKNLEYYLVVLPGDQKAGKWQLEELDTTPGARKHTTVKSGTFTPCNHPFQPKRVNRANFYTCTDSHMSDSVQKSGLKMFAPPKDPLWMDCAQGCCMADG